MSHFKLSLVNLVLGLAIFFNVERLDFGQENFVDIQSFVYLFGIVAILSVMLLPPLSRLPVSLSLTLWLGLFLICKFLVFNTRPVLGSVYTYLTITEAGLIAGLVVLAHRVGNGLQDFLEAVKNITLAKIGQQILQVEEAGELVRAEMTRSRHYHRPLSVIVAAPEADAVQVALPRLLQEAEQAFVHRYATARLAALMRKELRLIDTVLEDHQNSRFIILCPEINGQGCDVLVERIRAAVGQQLGVNIRCASASFPDKALTFEELISQAESQLQRETKQKSVPNKAALYPNTHG
ncbi:MAG TPA: hypothetical protein VF177_09195 [Anaerolineae bacterium]